QAQHSVAIRPGQMPSKTSWTDDDLAHPDFQFFEKYGKARVKETEKVLMYFCVCKSMQPFQGIDRRLRLGAWCDALSLIPIDELMPLAQEEWRHRTSDFFPTPADMHARRNGDETSVGDDGRIEKATRANVAAYESWDEQKARMERAAQNALPEPIPPLEIDPEDLKTRLGMGGRRAEIEKSLEAPESGFSPALLDIANALNVELDACTPQQVADLRALSLWWLRNYPHEAITIARFDNAWNQFTQWRSANRQPLLRQAVS
ncbi:MAG TPA: hypothetical protein VGB45_05240, partial [Abditibacterium sp.]